MLASLRLELRALLELYLLPGLPALMPWPLGFRWLRFVSRFQSLYEAEWRGALAQARQFTDVGDEALWARQFRLVRLVDHADLWISKTRSRRWLRRHMDVVAPWPKLDTPAVGVFFHVCPGLWAMRSLREQGVDTSVLAGHFSKRSMGGAWLAYIYGAIRLKELQRVAGSPLIFSPGTVKKSLAQLAGGGWVAGTPDVPPTETALGSPVTLFDRPAHFAEGLLVIARRANVPVVVFTFGLDIATGRRTLEVFGQHHPDEPGLLQHIADHWQRLLRERSWGFFLWGAMPAWFAPPR
ncbi:hypothetical protein OS187_09790 [Xanthomonadaceae bacterium JHOS43]|nr:hypothetical protein [Xanthomonadaceae bacterium JHOS43]MCX7564075.1 hypothetical protein [Xanthomonadaceae bacterium XH05]